MNDARLSPPSSPSKLVGDFLRSRATVMSVIPGATAHALADEVQALFHSMRGNRAAHPSMAVRHDLMRAAAMSLRTTAGSRAVVARSALGTMVGVVAYLPPDHCSDNCHILWGGTTGVQRGTGTTLVAAVARSMGNRVDIAVVPSATATTFWEQLGFRRGDGALVLPALTAAQLTRALDSAVGANDGLAR